MPSSGDFSVDEINHEKRFSVYVKTSWEIFTAFIQEIKDVALDKKRAKPEYSEKAAEELENTIYYSVGIIAGINIISFMHIQKLLYTRANLRLLSSGKNTRAKLYIILIARFNVLIGCISRSHHRTTNFPNSES